MPGDDLKLNLRLTADGKGFVGEVRIAKRELDKLTGSTRKSGRAAKEQADAFRQSQAATHGLSQALRAAHAPALRYLSVYFGAQGIGNITRGLVRHADSYTQISNAVRLATDAGANHAAIQSEIFDIAHRTRAPVQELADLFQKLTISSTDLGASNEQFLRVLEGVGQALVINGTSAQQARGALLQFSQAMSSNVVRAEEFNSILEGAKPILIAVANNLDAAGGSVGRLRKLVIEGQVSSREFFEAFERGLPELAENFERANSTIGQGLIQVDSALTKLIGRMDETSGASAVLAEALEGFATVLAEADAEEFAAGLDSVVTIVAALAGLMLGRALVGLTAYGAQTAAVAAYQQTLALGGQRAAAAVEAYRKRALAAAAASQRLGGAVNFTAGAMRGLGNLFRFATGPVGWIATAAFAFLSLRDATSEAGRAASDYERILDQVRSETRGLSADLDDLTDKELAAAVRRAGRTASQAAEEVASIQSDIINAEARVRDLSRSVQPSFADLAESSIVLNPRDFFAGQLEQQTEARAVALAAAQEYLDELIEKGRERRRAQQVADERLAAAELARNEARLRRDHPRQQPPGPRSPQSTQPTAASAADRAFRNLRRRFADEHELIELEYAERLNIISAAEKATEAEKTEVQVAALQARNQAIHKLYTDSQAAIAQADADARQKRDQALIDSGIPALQAFQARQKELAGVTDLSATALERQAAKTRISREVGEEYGKAHQSVRDAIVASRLAIEQQEAALGRQAEAYQRLTGNASQYAQQLRDLNAAEQLALANAANTSAKPSEIGAAQDDISANAEGERQRIAADRYLAANRNRHETELLMAEGYANRIEQIEDQHQKNLLGLKLKNQPILAAIAQQHSQTILALDRGEEASAKQKFTLGLDLAQAGFSQLAAHSKKAFKLNQAASIAQAIINTYESITKALAAYPPPFGFAAAGVAAAAGFAQVAAIRAQQPPQGYALGGVVDSPTFFSARGVPSGVAGEAGPEAILPLRRGRGGRLGVDAGAGMRPVVIRITIGDVVVQAAAGEQPQAVGSAVTGQVLAVLEPAVRRVISNEQRPGGLLNKTNTV